MKETDNPIKSILSVPVIVAALGYFVDIYDLLLFSIVRKPSLEAIGLTGQALTDTGLFLLNVQMAGLLIGGLLWGVLGDKIGRIKILFGSILTYSLANIANGFVDSVWQYSALRLIAGIGLAGELGAGVTLVLETLPQKHRGWGTMVVASVGVAGAVLANIIAKNFDWRIAYFIGGGLGLLLLLLRISAHESGMYQKTESRPGIKRGNFLSLFTNWKRFSKYAKSILVALPLWYSVGLLMTLSPEFGKAFNLSVPVKAGDAVMYFYIGLVIGDFLSGALSQMLRSRRNVILLFILLYAGILAFFFYHPQLSTFEFYMICLVMGGTCGYWAIFITSAAEQFGTNLRSTVASTAPNFIRASVIPISFSFAQLKPHLGFTQSAALVGLVCLLISFASAWFLDETYHKDLDYTEE